MVADTIIALLLIIIGLSLLAAAFTWRNRRPKDCVCPACCEPLADWERELRDEWHKQQARSE